MSEEWDSEEQKKATEAWFGTLLDRTCRNFYSPGRKYGEPRCGAYNRGDS